MGDTRPIDDPDRPEASEPQRWELIRDLLTFQVKLALDALRDVLLSPASLVAGILGIVFQPDRPGRLFYELLVLGRQSEHWIDLFGAASRIQPAPPRDVPPGNVDELVGVLERALVQQVERGGMTASAKRQLDRLLDSLERIPRSAVRAKLEAPRGEAERER